MQLEELNSMFGSLSKTIEELKTSDETELEKKQFYEYIFQISDYQVYHFLKVIRPDVFEEFLKWRAEIDEQAKLEDVELDEFIREQGGKSDV